MGDVDVDWTFLGGYLRCTVTTLLVTWLPCSSDDNCVF